MARPHVGLLVALCVMGCYDPPSQPLLVRVCWGPGSAQSAGPFPFREGRSLPGAWRRELRSRRVTYDAPSPCDGEGA